MPFKDVYKGVTFPVPSGLPPLREVVCYQATPAGIDDQSWYQTGMYRHIHNFNGKFLGQPLFYRVFHNLF